MTLGGGATTPVVLLGLWWSATYIMFLDFLFLFFKKRIGLQKIIIMVFGKNSLHSLRSSYSASMRIVIPNNEV
jgi:hypothetical protein